MTAIQPASCSIPITSAGWTRASTSWRAPAAWTSRNLQVAEPSFRGSPLVNIACAFRAPAMYGDTLEHRIAPPRIGGGRSYRVRHSFRKGAVLVAEGEQVRIWGMAGPGGEGLKAAPVPPDIAARLRGEAGTAAGR